MTELLADLLCARLKEALPFVGRAVGLARLYSRAEQDGETPITVKLPVPVSFTAAECDQNSRYLVPDATTAGILFFEDGGVQLVNTRELPAYLGVRVASLRLLLWVNPLLTDLPTDEITLLLAIERALRVHKRYTSDPFLDVLTTYATLPAETALYGRYSFATETPLLLPPYRLLGLDLKVQCRLRHPCPPVAPPVVAVPAPGPTGIAFDADAALFSGPGQASAYQIALADSF